MKPIDIRTPEGLRHLAAGCEGSTYGNAMEWAAGEIGRLRAERDSLYGYAVWWWVQRDAAAAERDQLQAIVDRCRRYAPSVVAAAEQEAMK